MKDIKEHIRTGSFKQFYLLYGSEDYLKKLYRDKLRAAIVQNGDDMNFTHFEGKDIDLRQVAEISHTLPFFKERRLVLLEDSGLFKSQNELSSMLSDIPDSTIVIFVETEVDKRNKLFKMVKDCGTVSEMNGLDEKNLKLFAASLLEQAKKRITESTVTYLIDRTGTDMYQIRNEVEKLICYAMDREVITTVDIDAVVSTQITGKIFQMIDTIANKQQGKALNLYYDLLSLREKPMTILFLITRHINILMQVKDMQALGFNQSEISKKASVPPFAVNKYISQSRNFTVKYLGEALELSTDIEERVKTGQLADRIGVELLIIRFSSK